MICVDVDECEADPCDTPTEYCSNLVGTYVCKCADELVRGEDGVCVTEEERRRIRDSMKQAKKKRKKKKKKGNPEEEEEEKVWGKNYSWYYTVAPLVVTFLIYKYWRPNLVTAMGTILFISASATLGPSESTVP